MNTKKKIAVCSRSFSKNEVLRSELQKKYKHVKFNDDGLSLSGDLLVEFLSEATHAIVALEKIDREILKRLPKLKTISKYGVGLDMIDMQSLREFNVELGWTGGVNKRSVSELVISLSISLLRHVSSSHREVLKGVWRQHVGRHLSSKTVGIIGCGHVGKDLVKLLQPFGCPILVNDIKKEEEYYKQNNIKFVSKELLLSESDIVTLHTPLDDSTRNMLTKDRLNLMKHDAILINLARGDLLDEGALKKMLIEGRIGGAALDVFSSEPPEDKELLSLPNFIVTPHIGGSASEAIMAMGRSAIDNLENSKCI